MSGQMPGTSGTGIITGARMAQLKPLEECPVRLLLWPFQVVWRLITLILNLTGRLVGLALGLALMAVGVLLTLSIVGAVVGIPLIALGFLLVVRSIF